MVQVLKVLGQCAAGAWRGKRHLLELTLNNMTQGVVLYSSKGRLVVFNDQYLSMYGLSPAVVKPGANLVDIIRERAKTGSLPRDPAEYCAELLTDMAAGKIVRFVTEAADGRSVSVVNRAISGSNYWVGTHDDITERRATERKNALLDEQEARRAVVEEAIAWFRAAAHNSGVCAKILPSGGWLPAKLS